MRRERALLRASIIFAAVLLALPVPAHAEKNVYIASAGGGTRVALTDVPEFTGVVVLQSTFGLARRLDLVNPLFIAVGPSPDLTAALGLAYACHRENHWRFDVGGGTSLGVPVQAWTQVEVGAFAATSIRWQFAWGVGLSLGLHLLYTLPVAVPPGPGALAIQPALSAYQEFW